MKRRTNLFVLLINGPLLAENKRAVSRLLAYPIIMGIRSFQPLKLVVPLLPNTWLAEVGRDKRFNASVKYVCASIQLRVVEYAFNRKYIWIWFFARRVDYFFSIQMLSWTGERCISRVFSLVFCGREKSSRRISLLFFHITGQVIFLQSIANIFV